METLRPLEIEDLVTLNSWRSNRILRNDTHAFRFPVNMEMDRAWFNENVVNASPGKAVFAIQTKDRSLAGLAQMDQIQAIHRHAALGLYIGDPTLRGQGLGAKSVLELMQFGFNDLNLNKIYVHVNKSNAGARALYKKLGFLEEGDLKHHYYNDGKWDDVVIMSIFTDAER